MLQGYLTWLGNGSSDNHINILSKIVNKLSVQIFLFVIALAITISATSAYAPNVAIYITALGALGMLVYFGRYYLLQKPSAAPLIVKLDFSPIEGFEVDLDTDKCDIDVRDKKGNKKQVTSNLTLGKGGWTLKLIENVEAYDSVRLELVERKGRKWRVKPFAPYEIDVKPIQI